MQSLADGCFYAGASAPEDLHAVIPIYGSHGDVLVTWTHQACRSPSEGYVLAFELMYCQLDSDNQCTGMWNTHGIHVGHELVYLVAKLSNSV